MTTLTMPRQDVLDDLPGTTMLLSVLADEMRPGDLILLGHCLRRLVHQRRRTLGHAVWSVSKHLDTDHTGAAMTVLGRQEFQDDGVTRFVVLRLDG